MTSALPPDANFIGAATAPLNTKTTTNTAHFMNFNIVFSFFSEEVISKLFAQNSKNQNMTISDFLI